MGKRGYFLLGVLATAMAIGTVYMLTSPFMGQPDKSFPESIIKGLGAMGLILPTAICWVIGLAAQ